MCYDFFHDHLSSPDSRFLTCYFHFPFIVISLKCCKGRMPRVTIDMNKLMSEVCFFFVFIYLFLVFCTLKTMSILLISALQRQVGKRDLCCNPISHYIEEIFNSKP